MSEQTTERREGHGEPRDHGATTHLEPYNAYEAHRRMSGFSGAGYALVETATGEVLSEHAFRCDALDEQTKVEAAALRDAAADHDRKATESWERSDTDGFVSQWAHGLSAQEARIQASIIEAGGTSTFLGLFDVETGERVKAKIVSCPGYHGGTTSKWLVLDAADNAVEWLPAYKGDSKRSKLAKRGFEERDEQAPAKAGIGGGSGRGLSGAVNCYATAKRTDGGYPPEAKTLAEIRSGS